jgi:exopolysaccharide biosynthesis polyprenyl glycosylphosphotransferase
MINPMPNLTTQNIAQHQCNQIDILVSSPGSETLKRMMDVTLASASLVFLAPVFVLTACLIKLQDGGPIFFRQKRIGRDGVPFWCYKFRSMVTNAETLREKLAAQNVHGEAGITFKIKADPRITPIGRFIRKMSIDELPQLFNVLRGEMSLVGPRPPVPSEVAQYNERQLQRLTVLPGLTCLWQVSGRAELPFDEQVRLDLEYIARRSLLLDITLLLKTIPAVISGRGAC